MEQISADTAFEKIPCIGIRAPARAPRIGNLPSGSDASDRQSGGYLTIYLSLCLTLFLSLFLTLIEGARMSSIRMQIELSTDAAMNSVLAEYNRELLSKYDLFFVDCSYCRSGASLERTKERLKHYLEENYTSSGGLFSGLRDLTALTTEELEITGTRFAADSGGKALRQQIQAVYASDPLEAGVVDLLASADTFHGLSESADTWEEQRQENQQELEEVKELARERQRELQEKRSGRKEDGSEEADEDSEAGADVSLDEPTESIRAFASEFILTQVLTGGECSDRSVQLSDYLSHRSRHYGSSLDVQNTHGYAEADEIVFDEYVLERCGTYTERQEGGELSYEAEYVLCGQASDRDNLADLCARLLAVRQAANCIHIFSDSAKQAEAGILAAAVSFLILVPEAEEVLKTAILFAWAYLESVSDVRTLLSGGRVPLLKDSGTWRTSLFGILSPASAPVSGRSSGLSYRDYLSLFLYFTAAGDKNFRLMDIMEMNIRGTEGNQNFRMDWCMDAYALSSVTKSAYGWSYAMNREISYD